MQDGPVEELESGRGEAVDPALRWPGATRHAGLEDAGTVPAGAAKLMTSWRSFTGRLLRQRGFTGFLASTFSLGIGYAFVLPYLSLWGTGAVGFSVFQFGLFMTATSLSGIGVSTVLARLSDTRVSRRAILMLGGGAGVLGYAGYAFVRDPLLLVVVGVTAIALSSVCFSQLFATARDWFTREPALRRRSA